MDLEWSLPTPGGARPGCPGSQVGPGCASTSIRTASRRRRPRRSWGGRGSPGGPRQGGREWGGPRRPGRSGDSAPCGSIAAADGSTSRGSSPGSRLAGAGVTLRRRLIAATGRLRSRRPRPASHPAVWRSRALGRVPGLAVPAAAAGRGGDFERLSAGSLRLPDPIRRRPSRSTARRPGSPRGAATNRWNGSVVWMPLISTSSRARRSRAMARAAVDVDDHELGDERVVVGRTRSPPRPRCRPGRPVPPASASGRSGPAPGRSRVPDPRPRAGPRSRGGSGRAALWAAASDRVDSGRPAATRAARGRGRRRRRAR